MAHAVCDALLSCKEVVFASIKAPAQYGQMLTKLRHDQRTALLTFSSQLRMVLDKSEGLTVGVNAMSLASQFREALIGRTAEPNDDETYPRCKAAGLVDGNCQPLVTLLTNNPALLQFLHRELVAPNGPEPSKATANSAESSSVVDSGGMRSPKQLADSISSLMGGSNSGSRGSLNGSCGLFSATPVMDAVRSANMLYVSLHPEDIEVAIRAATHNDSSSDSAYYRQQDGTAGGDQMERKLRRLLFLNLRLRYPSELWAPLLEIRDEVVNSLNAERYDRNRALFDGNLEVSSCVDKCVTVLQWLPSNVTPQHIHELMSTKLVQAKRELQHIIMRSGADAETTSEDLSSCRAILDANSSFSAPANGNLAGGGGTSTATARRSSALRPAYPTVAVATAEHTDGAKPSSASVGGFFKKMMGKFRTNDEADKTADGVDALYSKRFGKQQEARPSMLGFRSKETLDVSGSVRNVSHVIDTAVRKLEHHFDTVMKDAGDCALVRRRLSYLTATEAERNGTYSPTDTAASEEPFEDSNTTATMNPV